MMITLGTQFTRLGNPVPRHKDLTSAHFNIRGSFTVMKSGRVRQLTKIVQIRGIFSSSFAIYVIFIFINFQILDFVILEI